MRKKLPDWLLLPVLTGILVTLGGLYLWLAPHVPPPVSHEKPYEPPQWVDWVYLAFIFLSLMFLLGRILRDIIQDRRWDREWNKMLLRQDAAWEELEQAARKAAQTADEHPDEWLAMHLWEEYHKKLTALAEAQRLEREELVRKYR